MDVPLSDLRETLEHFLNEQVFEGQDNKVASRNRPKFRRRKGWVVRTQKG